MSGDAERAGTSSALVAALAFAIVGYSLQQTLVLPALPTLQRDLNTTTGWTTWVVSGFLLSSSIALPLIGRLGDQLGKRRMLLAALGLFLVGSVVASAAPNIAVLIAARVIQGAGVGVFPLSAAIVRDEVPARRVSVIVSFLYAMAAAGTSLGSIFSGLIVDHTSWRLLFIFAAIPVAGAVAMVAVLVPESRATQRTRRDVPGAVLLSLGLGALLLVLTEGNVWSWHSLTTLCVLATAAALLCGWGVVELRTAEPMVDVRLLATRSLLLVNGASLLLGVCFYPMATLVPRFVETPRGLGESVARAIHYGFGASATTAGLVLFPGFALGLASAPLAAVIGRRVGFKWPLVAASALMAAGACVAAIWHGRVWELVAAATLIGCAFPVAAAMLVNIVIETVRSRETALAASMTQVARAIGGAVGVQLGATLLGLLLASGTSAPSSAAFEAVFWLCAGAAGAAALLAAALRPRSSGPAGQGRTS